MIEAMELIIIKRIMVENWKKYAVYGFSVLLRFTLTVKMKLVVIVCLVKEDIE